MMTVQYDPASRPHIQTNHIDGPPLSEAHDDTLPDSGHNAPQGPAPQVQALFLCLLDVY